ncbi:TetR/AcrR family transcriptional regulator [Streptomyces sp. NBC_00103]|uniref:TetR/AcrR family transcriptional regulator n=1 Tax=Streptomyces sp. NBC_00103 TaxID=2975653 RepID=UPI0022567BFF|nr:helix-turn-helix domain-containing protein [Streptomyces sp. NBC_00103]MCX5372470.1 TetR/AcrR family transcriptional regulator [Streptomyces sp. NBC_00103]
MTTPSARAGTKGVPRARREQQILAAATEEFGRNGYEGTSLAAVAARVGVTKTLLHQYFGAKHDLYLACLVPAADRILSAIRTAMHDTAGEDTTGEGSAREGSARESPAGGESAGKHAAARETVADPARAVTPSTPLRVMHGVFTALEGRREAWFVLYDTSVPADSEAARRARRYRAAIDECAAMGTADVLRAAESFDALDADALSHAWRGLATALIRWWINHPDESADAMTERCARLFTAARDVLGP